VSSNNSNDAEDRRLVRTRWPGIYERGGGYVVRFRDANGKQRQRAARTLAEARRLRSELVTDVARGEYRPDTKAILAEYAQTWLESYAGRTSRGLRAETLAEYRRDLSLVVEQLGRLRLAEISPADVKAFARTLAEQGLAPATVQRRLAAFKALLATAVEEGLIRANPTAGVRIGAPVTANHDEDGPVKVLSASELERLVAEVPDDWRRLLVRLLAQTGLRISEGLGLRWADVDGTGRVHVRRRIRNGRAGAPKSRAGRREVPISSALLRDLKAHKLRSRFSADTDYVFTGPHGTPAVDRGCYPWLKAAAARAGAPWAAFHTLRHTAATRWLLSGVTIAQVARLLGHHDAAFTLRTYISVLPADLPSGEALAQAVGMA
jgi:integrase